jgi:hypothetical protein
MVYGTIEKIKDVLVNRKNIKWVIGGSCSGKTTLCGVLTKANKDISLYDMDEHIFGHYMPRYNQCDHPANSAWFSAANPLDWALSLSLEDFDKFNRKANLEYLQLFAEDMTGKEEDRIILVDGGISYPSMLAKVIPVENIKCLNVPIEESERIWETAESKKTMKNAISQLPDPDLKWRKFLDCNRFITNTIVNEARECGIEIFERDSLSIALWEDLGSDLES